MDKATLEKLVKLLSSETDTDAAMGLRSLQGYFRDEGTDLGRVIEFAIANMDELKKQGMTIEHVMGDPAKKSHAPVNMSGMPQCWSPKSGCIELIPSGETTGDVVQLTGESSFTSFSSVALSMMILF